MRRSIRQLLALMLVVLTTTGAWAQMSEDGVKAGLIFNFIKFAEWQTARLAPHAPLHLCMLGQREMNLGTLAPLSGKMVQGHSLVVRPVKLKDGLVGCHVVVVGSSERPALAEVLHTAHNAGALTISDMENFVEAGGIIGLTNDNGHMRFDINLDSAHRADIRLSIQVLRLARQVKTGT